MNKSKDEILREIEKIRNIHKMLLEGKKVCCPKCGAVLTLYKYNSGRHPGIYCPNGDFEVLHDTRKLT